MREYVEVTGDSIYRVSQVGEYWWEEPIKYVVFLMPEDVKEEIKEELKANGKTGYVTDLWVSCDYTKLEENKFRVELKRIAQLCNLDKVDSTTMIEIEQSAQHAYYEGMR